jgi:hypothetical protein
MPTLFNGIVNYYNYVLLFILSLSCYNLIKLFKMKFVSVMIVAAAANQYDFMGEDELLSQLSSTLVSAQRSEAMGDGDAAVAKTAAIKNI